MLHHLAVTENIEIFHNRQRVRKDRASHRWPAVNRLRVEFHQIYRLSVDELFIYNLLMAFRFSRGDADI
jgi:hypothetical protein